MEIEKPYDHSSPSLKDVEFFVYSKQGIGPGKVECQDTYSIIHDLEDGTHFFAVYDGHGKKGRDVSLFVNKRIENALKKDSERVKRVAEKGYVEGFFKDFFKAVDAKLHKSGIDTLDGGSCCNAVFISGNMVYAMNVGDSRSVMCRQGKAMNLSVDQKPTRKDEQARVLQAGGIVKKKKVSSVLRVWDKDRTSGLAMTRTFGDIAQKKAGVIPVPEVHQYELKEGDEFIIVASDGIWDVMSSDEAVGFVLDHLEDGKAREEVARELALEARKRWKDEDPDDPYVDDITVVIAFPKFEGGKMDLETDDTP